MYRITHRKTGDFYIGSSNNIHDRASQHVAGFKGYHDCRRIRELIYRHGAKFDFDVLELHPDYIVRECHWIEKLKPTLNGNRRPGNPRRPLRDSINAVEVIFHLTGNQLRELQRRANIDGDEPGVIVGKALMQYLMRLR